MDLLATVKLMTNQRFVRLALLAAPLASSCAASPRGTHFGEPLPAIEPVPVEEVLAAPGAFLGQETVIEGRPSSVCLVKGCWMIFDNGLGGAAHRSMRVMFKDHAFFVPTDSAGRSMRLAGVLTERTISEADARHYLEDAGRADEARKISGPQRELRFTATGVVLDGP